MTTDKIIYTIILGIIVGILGGWQGQSGSIYILIGLLAFGIVDDEHTAAGTALLYTSVPVSLGATYLYYKKGYVNMEAGLILIPVVFLFSMLGSKLNFYIDEKHTLYMLGICELAIAAYVFSRAYYLK